MRFSIFCIIFSFGYALVYAQNDSATLKKYFNLKDTAQIQVAAYKATIVPDSLKKTKHLQFLQDSIAMLYLVVNPNRENEILTEIFKNNPPDFFSYTNNRFKPGRALKTGQIRASRDPWIIETLIGLLIYSALLNLLFNKEMKSVLLSFYNKSQLSQMDKDSPAINIGAGLGLFLLFNLSLGLLLYQLTVYENVSFKVAGFQLFVTISASTCLLFLLKFMALKFIGLVFDINRLVSRYITIINLTYFNIAFLFLGAAVCFSLLNNHFIPGLIVVTMILTAIIFAWQYLKNSVSMISSFRFRKFYLFIYLCALEICPVLVLIKALNI